MIDLNARHICQPNQSRLIIADNMFNYLLHLTMSLYIDRLDPCWMMRPIFLDKRFPAVDTVRIPVQHQRALAQILDHLRSHRGVVMDHVPLRDSFLDPHRLVEIGENDLPARYLHNLTSRFHTVHLPANGSKY